MNEKIQELMDLATKKDITEQELQAIKELIDYFKFNQICELAEFLILAMATIAVTYILYKWSLR